MSLWSRTTIIVILVTSLPLSGYLFVVSCMHLYKSGSRYFLAGGVSASTSSVAGTTSGDALIPMIIAAAQVLGSISNFVNQSLFLVQAVVPASYLPIGGCLTWIWVADIAYLMFQPCATLVIIHRATAVISPKAIVWYKRRTTVQLVFSVGFLTGYLLVALSVFMRRIWTDTTSDTCGAAYVVALNSAGKMIFFALYMALAVTFAFPLLRHLQQTSVIRESKTKLPSRTTSATAKPGASPHGQHAQSAEIPTAGKMMSTDHRGDNDEYKVGAISSTNGRRSLTIGTYQVTSLPQDHAAIANTQAGGGNNNSPSPIITPNRTVQQLRPATSPSTNALHAKDSTEDKLRRLLHDVTFRIMIAVLAYLATATAALFGGFDQSFAVQFTFENLAALYAATLSSGKRYRKRPTSSASLASVVAGGGGASPRGRSTSGVKDNSGGAPMAKLARSISGTSNRAVAMVVGTVVKTLSGKGKTTNLTAAPAAAMQTTELSPSEACFQSPGISSVQDVEHAPRETGGGEGC